MWRSGSFPDRASAAISCLCLHQILVIRYTFLTNMRLKTDKHRNSGFPADQHLPYRGGTHLWNVAMFASAFSAIFPGMWTKRPRWRARRSLPPSVAMHSTWNAEVAVPNTNPLGNSAWLSLPVLTAARAHHKLSSSSGTTTSGIS